MPVGGPPPQLEDARRAVGDLRKGDAAALTAWLRRHLFSDVLPFWEKHARDERGGILTCLAGDGRILSTDKWLWSQWRMVWTFSRIYNQLDPDPRWLAWARSIADFCIRSGWDAKGGGWALVLDRDGNILRGHESTYTDAFAVYGLQELFKACADDTFLILARKTADAALARIARPRDQIPHFPYPMPPGAKSHGVPMLWSLSLAELGATTRNGRYLAAALALSAEIFSDFYQAGRDVMVEFVRPDGQEYPAPRGTAIVPGHVVEDMWFQVHVAELAARGGARDAKAFRLMLRHLELGWDRAHGGGLLLAVDADGGDKVGWDFADTKLWWPQTEALYGTLLGWHRTRNPAFLDWYEKIWAVCLEHFVDRTHGEWRQKLDRHFHPIDDVVALPVKDPFHLSRSLILQIELLGRSDSPALRFGS